MILFVLALPAIGSEAVLRRAASYVIMRNEGFRAEPYVCSNGHATVGYGHKMTDEEPRRRHTREEAKRLFLEDLEKKLKLARRLLPEFDEYPVQVRVAVLDGCFRGCLSGSPKALRLMREARWVEASEEYLDHRGYRKSKSQGTGVYKRMDRNAFVFRRYGQKLRGEL